MRNLFQGIWRSGRPKGNADGAFFSYESILQHFSLVKGLMQNPAARRGRRLGDSVGKVESSHGIRVSQPGCGQAGLICRQLDFGSGDESRGGGEAQRVSSIKHHLSLFPNFLGIWHFRDGKVSFTINTACYVWSVIYWHSSFIVSLFILGCQPINCY